MATLNQLQNALINADKAGDADGARALAQEIRRVQSTQTQSDNQDMARLADPTAGMSGFEKFSAGMGKAAYDTARGVGQLFGATNRQDVAESRRLDKPLMSTGAGMAGNVLGNIAIATPTAFVPGANTVTGAATIGGLMGLIQPSTSTAETAKNVLLGGGMSAALPASVNTFRVAKSFAEPFYQSGRNQIIGRALNKAAGEDPSSVINAMSNAKSGVPGVQYTAAEAAQNPGIAAMQRAATAVDPIASNQVSAQMAQNNAARVAALEDMSGVGGKRDFFAANRDTTANALYDAARKQGVSASAMTPEAQASFADFYKRIPDDVIGRAKELAKLQGVDMDQGSVIDGLHWIKRAIDSKIGTAARAGDNEMTRAYTGLKNDLLDHLDTISPAYGEARRTFADMSKPLTEMDVTQAIADRSINKLTGNLQPSAYARALSDKTAQSVTGMPKATLGGTVKPESMATLNAIKEDLQRLNFASNAGRGAGSDTVQKLAYSNMLDQAGVPNAVRAFAPTNLLGNVAQRFSQLAYSDANNRIASELAQALLDPKKTAQLMQAGIRPSEINALTNLIYRGGTAAGASVPALIQANQ